jgi:HK97 family phage prohead protease
MDLEQQLASGRPEARSVTFTDLDVTNGGRSLDGYAAVYGQETDLGQWTEVIVAPAFRGAPERSGNIPMLWDHNAGLPPLATTGGGTLEVQEDGRGLRVKAQIDERHMLGPTLMSMLERGDVKGMSFGFVARGPNSKAQMRNGRLHRILKGFDRLLDVSPTWDPAYSGTSAELRSLRQLATIIDAPEQDPQAEVTEHGEDGPAVEDHDVAVPDATTEEPAATTEDSEEPVESEEEQRSRAALEAEQRRRRLQLLGVAIPRA